MPFHLTTQSCQGGMPTSNKLFHSRFGNESNDVQCVGGKQASLVLHEFWRLSRHIGEQSITTPHMRHCVPWVAHTALEPIGNRRPLTLSQIGQDVSWKLALNFRRKSQQIDLFAVLPQFDPVFPTENNTFATCKRHDRRPQILDWDSPMFPFRFCQVEVIIPSCHVANADIGFIPETGNTFCFTQEFIKLPGFRRDAIMSEPHLSRCDCTDLRREATVCGSFGLVNVITCRDRQPLTGIAMPFTLQKESLLA